MILHLHHIHKLCVCQVLSMACDRSALEPGGRNITSSPAIADWVSDFLLFMRMAWRRWCAQAISARPTRLDMRGSSVGALQSNGKCYEVLPAQEAIAR
jgi:hypothetical protein